MANNPYVNKVIYGNNTVMDISDTTATESDVANGKAFYKSSGARATGTASLDSAVWGNITGTLADQTDLQDELDEKLPQSVNNVMGAKNLLPNKNATQTKNGITFTVNADGSVVANGTATDDAILSTRLYFSSLDVSILGGRNYIFSGCTNGSSSTYYLYYAHTNKSGTIANYQLFDGEITVPIETNVDYITYYIIVKSGTTVNNVAFYPMLRLSEYTDDTYEPHAMSNVALTDAANHAYRDDVSPYYTFDPENADYFPYYDASASEKKSVLWSDIKYKIRAFLDGYYTYPIERGLVTATAGTAIRIPASGTTSHITINSRVIPMAEAKSDGTPYKYSSIKVYDGYLEIKLAENISNLTIGVLVVNHSG